MSTPCATLVNQEFPEVTKEQADEILLRVKNMAELRAKTNGGNMAAAVEEATKILQQQDKLTAANNRRAAYLNADAEQKIAEYIGRFPTLGEGLLAVQDSSGYKIKGARMGIDQQFRALNNAMFGKVATQLEEAGVFRDFRTNALAKEVYIESAQLQEGGKPGISGSEKAVTMAKILEAINKELVARLNRAGAYIADLPGYLARQTHDMYKIRAAGDTKEQAYKAWHDFVMPRLDELKTFLGRDPDKMMRGMFDALYSGVHGTMGEEGQGIGGRSLGGKMSEGRVIHFKDAESAWEYNAQFGTKDLKQQVMTDISTKARAITLMENLGEAPQQTLLNSVRRAKELARAMPDAAKQVDSINDEKIMAAYRQLTGVNDIPSNPTLARVSSNIRVVTQMIDMGRVLLTNMFSDRAFMQAELASDGLKHMDILAKQVTSFAKRTPEQTHTLRMMGVGLDGLIGNALSRYSATGTASKMLDKAQKLFFDINFHNYWSDVTKSATAEALTSFLGQHADTAYTKLPADLRDRLMLYDIDKPEWDLLRSTAYEHPSNWGKMISPDMVAQIPDANIKQMLDSKGVSSTARSVIKTREKLALQLNTFISDRTEYAVPTGGSQVRRILTGDTKAGTGAGELMRLMGMFKSFPMAVATRVIQREIYGRGNFTAKQWLMNDHAGKFHLAQLAAMTTVAGYLSMVVRDALDGKEPKPLTAADGSVNWHTLNEAAIRGGGLGIMGEMIMSDYDKSYRTVLKNAAGPVLSKLDTIADLKTKATNGELKGGEVGKFALDNTPLINLFYVRPILNYYVLWNLQELMNPGSLKRTESFAKKQYNQDYFFAPSDNTK